jgi:tRNA(Ile)-lysidine synthase
VGGTAGRLVLPLVETVERTLRRQRMLTGGETVLVGVSGGADSVALLTTLLTLAPARRLTLRVLHVDHGLRQDSARDADFVRRLGERLGVPVDVAVVHVGPGSVEAAARAVRHAALEAAADRVGATRIALGHTADDQAETVLMRLIEGTGLRGLAGIPPVRGRFIRPLIDARHRDAVAALEATGLPWVEDLSNEDPKFFRNRVRHELLPLLGAVYEPDIVARLAAVSRAARRSVDELEETAARELDRLAERSPAAVTLSRAALAGLPPGVAAEVLRRAAATLGSRAPLRAWGHRGLRRVLAPTPPRRPFRLGGVSVDVSGDRVRVDCAPLPALVSRVIDTPGRVELPEIGRALEAIVVSAAGYALPREPGRAAFDADRLPPRLLVRARRRGDRLTAFGGGERRLKSLMIDVKVPRWERSRVPLIEADGEIVWAAGLRRAATAPVSATTRRVLELRLVVLA